MFRLECTTKLFIGIADEPLVSGRDGGLQAEFERVVAPLRGCALVARFGLGAIGLVAAGPHGRFNGFEVSAGPGVKQSVQPGHTVRPLWPQA